MSNIESVVNFTLAISEIVNHSNYIISLHLPMLLNDQILRVQEELLLAEELMLPKDILQKLDGLVSFLHHLVSSKPFFFSKFLPFSKVMQNEKTNEDFSFFLVTMLVKRAADSSSSNQIQENNLNLLASEFLNFIVIGFDQMLAFWKTFALFKKSKKPLTFF